MGVQIPPWEGAIFGENGCPVVKYRDTIRSSVQRRLRPIGMPFGLSGRMGRRNHVLDGGP